MSKNAQRVESAITFHAILGRLTTTVDGGWRVSFDVPQSDREAIMALSELRDVELAIAVAKVGESSKGKLHRPKRPELEEIELCLPEH